MGLKKYFIGSYLPTREIDVHPSMLGKHQLIRFKFADQINDTITVMMGTEKQYKHKCLRFTFMKLL